MERGGNHSAAVVILRRCPEAFAARVRGLDRDIVMNATGPWAHDDDARWKVDGFEDAMRDEYDRPAFTLPKAKKVVVKPHACDLVERGEWLVHQKNLRPHDQSPCDRDPHFHSTRELARVGICETLEANHS